MGDRGPDVRRQEQFQAPGHTIAIHCSNDGLGKRLMLEQGMIDNLRHSGIGGEITAHIRTCTKGALTGSGQDNTAVARVLQRLY
jgi:hypothetical protein